ncbi:MAG: DUF1501 domain-containing protein [Phycisphaera sp.]|nr:MAG: DUF1501 domain-containing protein [Phycisphaera sp.]
MSLHNDPSQARAFTRRMFLGQSLTFASAAAVVPSFIQSSALGMPMPDLGMSSIPGANEDNILVVVQLGGGNDGLNTVVPVRHDEYYRARPTIGIARNQALELSRGSDIALHPAMEGIKALYDEGLCGLIQGTGYPNPNRSHFKSMDIWHTADTTGTGNGWIGRYLDSECCGYGKGESGAPDGSEEEIPMQPAIAIGRTAPLAMEGGSIKPIAFESADLFRWTGQDIHESLREPYTSLTSRGTGDDHDDHPTASFLLKTSLDAQVSSDLIRRAVSQAPMTQFPGTPLGRQLQMVSSMIRAGLKTRVYYVSMGGFDTHAGQGNTNGSHANLLRQFSDAMRAFYSDLKRHENDTRVLSMCFSEFGRRVSQNASGGTDHGTAAPMFLFGPMVRQGIIGRHPSLTNLDNGDLKYEIDFRSVYAGILESWLSADSNEILQGRYRPLQILRKS